jgi:outer membrane beta-barrel protein
MSLRSPLPSLVRGLLAAAWLAAIACLAGVHQPARADSPGLEALDDYKDGKDEKHAVENRFFLKAGRFEIAPQLGYVPNNPFARRYLGGATVGLHLSELLSVQMQLMYAPDLDEGDVKGLVNVLLDRANQADANNANFQQPLDKAALTYTAGLAWSPLYGKINLLGETVLNFDFYLYGGVGLISKNNYNAKYDTVGAANGDNLTLEPAPEANELEVGPFVGIGQNYFVNRLMAVKIDVRAAFYVDNKPQYDPEVPVNESRVYNNVIAGVGLGFFFPNMKPRLYEF